VGAAKLQEFTCEWVGKWAECGAGLMAIFWSQRWLWDGREWFDDALADYRFQQLLVWHYANTRLLHPATRFACTRPVLR